MHKFNLSTTKNLLKYSQPARMAIDLANHLHMYPEKNELIRYSQLVDGMIKHGKGEPKMKSVRTLAKFLYSSGIVNITDEGLLQMMSYETVKQLLAEYPCTDKDLMSAKHAIWLASMEKGPGAMEFLKEGGEGIIRYERRRQKEVIPGIVSDIVNQCEKRMKQHNFQGKPMIYDIGCGDGAIAIEVARKMKNATIYAYDPNPEAIIKAKADKPKELTNLTFSTDPLPGDGQVHMVLCINVLHDVKKPGEFLQMIRKKLHNIGIAMIVDPTVSVHKEKTLYIRQVVEALALGSLGCVHSNDCSHAMGPGIGKETLLQYIESNRLRVIGDMLLADSLFYHSFIAEKNPSAELIKYQFVIDRHLKI